MNYRAPGGESAEENCRRRGWHWRKDLAKVPIDIGKSSQTGLVPVGAQETPGQVQFPIQ